MKFIIFLGLLSLNTYANDLGFDTAEGFQWIRCGNKLSGNVDSRFGIEVLRVGQIPFERYHQYLIKVTDQLKSLEFNYTSTDRGINNTSNWLFEAKNNESFHTQYREVSLDLFFDYANGVKKGDLWIYPGQGTLGVVYWGNESWPVLQPELHCKNAWKFSE